MLEPSIDAGRTDVPQPAARPSVPPAHARGWPRRVSTAVRRPGVWILFVLALIGATFALYQARGPEVTTSTASVRDLEQHLIASGRVRIVNHLTLSAQTTGRVTAVHVREGDAVLAGQLLVEIDDREPRAAVAQARAAVDAAQGRVRGLTQVDAVVSAETRRRAQTSLARAEAELARLETLVRAGAVAVVDLEDARRDVAMRRADVTAAEAQESAARSGGAAMQAALGALRESEARLRAAEVRLADVRIVAPAPGVVLTRAVEPGDTAQAGVPLMEIAAGTDTQLVIQPDERHLAWLRLGQMALASADAFPEQRFDAEVCYIAPAVDVRRGSIEVRLCVAEPPAYLKPDMTVSVDLTLASRTRVIAVPSEAVRDAATPAASVWVLRDGRVERRPVDVGIRGEGHSEILTGLEEGDEVVLDAGRALQRGDRVRPER